MLYNTMYYRRSDDDSDMTIQVFAPEKELERIMFFLFSHDDYIFKFDKEPPFENVAPMDR